VSHSCSSSTLSSSSSSSSSSSNSYDIRVNLALVQQLITPVLNLVLCFRFVLKSMTLNDLEWRNRRLYHFSKSGLQMRRALSLQ